MRLVSVAAAVAIVTAFSGSLSAQILTAPQAKALADSTAALATAASQHMPALHAEILAHHNLMFAALRQDPAAARANAIDAATRAALVAADPSADILLEREVSVTGQLGSAVADLTDGTSATLYILRTSAGDREVTFSSAAAEKAGNKLAEVHAPVTLSGLALDSLIGVDALQPAIAPACTSPVPNAATQLHPMSTVTSCSTKGNQSTAIILVSFAGSGLALPSAYTDHSYWQSQLSGPNPSVNGYWTESSYAQITASGDVFGPISVPGSYDCTTTTQMESAVLTAAAGTVDYTQYSRIMIVFPATTCTFGGLGTIGCFGEVPPIKHPYSTVWIPITVSSQGDSGSNLPDGGAMWKIMAHELGHNLGLNHSNTLDFGSISLGPLDFYATNPGSVAGYGGATGAPPTRITAVNTEYGDDYSVMGNGSGPYPAKQRASFLGWIPPLTDQLEISTSGSYTLAPTEDSSGPRSLHILRDAFTGSYISIEYHEPSGYYYPGGAGSDFAQGAHMFYDDGRNDRLHTYLLDMSPSATPNDFIQGDLHTGDTWSDPYTLLNISVAQQSSDSLVVNVTYDPNCVQLSATQQLFPASGGTGVFYISAPSTCAWSTFTNAKWINFSGPTSGTGNGAVPFTVDVNPAIESRDTFLNGRRQNLHVIQEGGAATIISLTPINGSSVAYVPQAFTLTYDDAQGLSDIAQTYLSFDGDTSSDCQIYATFSGSTVTAALYDSANSAYTPSISLVPASTGSISVNGCTLNAQGSGYTSSGTTAQLTVNVTFTVAAIGPHKVEAYLYSKLNPTGATLGTWTVVKYPYDFSLTPNPPAFTLNAGDTATSTLSITPLAPSFTFPANITFTCTGAPYDATCTITPLQVTPGSSTATDGLVFTTVARTRVPFDSGLSSFGPFALLSLTSFLWLRSRRRKTLGLVLALTLSAGFAFLSGCGDGRPPTRAIGTPAGPATLTITGTAIIPGGATLTHTTTINVVVN